MTHRLIPKGIYYYDNGKIGAIQKPTIYEVGDSIIRVCPEYTYNIEMKGEVINTWTTPYAKCGAVFVGNSISVTYSDTKVTRITLRAEQICVLVKPGPELFINDKYYSFQDKQGEYM